MSPDQKILYGVIWLPVQGAYDDLPWIETTLDIQDQLGISRYKLTDAGDSAGIYRYQLNFTNTKGWGFAFMDGAEETYTCSTIVNGDHNVQYNSDRPHIMYVSIN